MVTVAPRKIAPTQPPCHTCTKPNSIAFPKS
jgi:hypothetical protein